MSSEQDEADQGPEIPANDNEGHSGDDEAEDDVLSREEHSEAKERVLNSNGLEDDQYSIDAIPSSPPVFKRPSSADGSISIPDDTPSLQVGVVSCSKTRKQALIILGFCGILARQASATPYSWPKSYPLPTAIRQALRGSNFTVPVKFTTCCFSSFPQRAFAPLLCNESRYTQD